MNPADFSAPVANPYFPLKPGTVFVYRGTEGPDRLVEHLRVTGHTKMIQGVSTIVIRDVLFANGRLAEKTTDWYADDNGGTTWYFGEDTAVYDRHGHVTSREGSWQAGVDGGVAGIIMPANPTADRRVPAGVPGRATPRIRRGSSDATDGCACRSGACAMSCAPTSGRGSSPTSCR